MLSCSDWEEGRLKGRLFQLLVSRFSVTDFQYTFRSVRGRVVFFSSHPRNVAEPRSTLLVTGERLLYEKNTGPHSCFLKHRGTQSFTPFLDLGYQRQVFGISPYSKSFRSPMNRSLTSADLGLRGICNTDSLLTPNVSVYGLLKWKNNPTFSVHSHTISTIYKGKKTI